MTSHEAEQIIHSRMDGMIRAAIAQLRSHSRLSIQPLWHSMTGEVDATRVLHQEIGATWPIANLNHRGHIAWPRGRQELWLWQSITLPSTLAGYPLVDMSLKLSLVWWADLAEVYVDGALVQTGDIFDCVVRIPLRASVRPGQTVTVALRLLSPGHDDGALVSSELIYESNQEEQPEPSFVADELAVLQSYLTALQPETLTELAEAVQRLDWSVVCDRSAFQTQLHTLRQTLMPLGNWLKQREIICMGHAHLDLAWLWSIQETWVAAERTFKSVLALQQDFPELTYTHSSPALFEWLEVNRPELFRQIQQVAQAPDLVGSTAGQWEIAAGLWVEPELNVVTGESIVRQVLYGQRYTQQRFGYRSRIAWLPDTFGFCGQLPQILALGGVDCFATQKLGWNDTNPFPHGLFWWRAPDGTQILGWTLPPIGTQIDPVKMADYACQWEQQTQLPFATWLPGVGDHGGGPTRDMLQLARRWARSPLFPRLAFGTPTGFLSRLEDAGMALGQRYSREQAGNGEHGGFGGQVCHGDDGDDGDSHGEPGGHGNGHVGLPLPVWDDELYLELHRGCYTTHADQKWANRRSEDGLMQAELWSTLAHLLTGFPYPQAEIEAAWKAVLFNQFHDILPGSSIPEVFVEANQSWARVLATVEVLNRQALSAIADHMDYSHPPHPNAIPIIVFNALNWHRSEVITWTQPAEHAGTNWIALSATGTALPIQLTPTGQLLIAVDPVPAIGYHRIWLVPTGDAPLHTDTTCPATWVLENEYLRVTLDPTTGDLQSVWDRMQQRSVLTAPGNQLQAFRDQGQYWDAWNIAPDYQSHPLPPTQLQQMQWIEWGAVRQRLRVVRTVGQSTFQQDYVLDIHSPVLRIETQADWQETQVVLKAAFPLTVEADSATYETAFGAIARSTRGATPADQAKWEVPALRWADLSQCDDVVNYGVSILTDGKHGYDSQPNQLRLTLLKAPLWPDPQADRGRHQFTYALYPHRGSWQSAQTIHRAHELNCPLQVIQPLVPRGESALAEGATGTRDEEKGLRNVSQPTLELASRESASQTVLSQLLPSQGSLLSLGDNSLVLSALKLGEDDLTQVVLRCYESQGTPADFSLQGEVPWQFQRRLTLLEEPLQPDSNWARGEKSHTASDPSPPESTQSQHDPSTALFQVQPWQLVTIAMTWD